MRAFPAVSMFAIQTFVRAVKAAANLGGRQARVGRHSIGSGAGDRLTKQGFETRTATLQREYLRRHRACGVPINQESRLMGPACAAFYGAPHVAAALSDSVPASRRCATTSGATVIDESVRPDVTMAVAGNGRRLRCLVKEHDLQLKRGRRYIVTSGINHAGRFSRT